MAKLFMVKKSEYWYCEYYDWNKKRIQRSTQTKNKRAAQAKADQWEKEGADDTFVRTTTTLHDALDNMVKSKKAAGNNSAATIEMYEEKAKAIKTYFKPDFKLADIKAVTLDEYVNHRLGLKKHRGTVRMELTTISQALKLAMRQELWSGDVKALIPRNEKAYTPRERVLTPGEINSLIHALPEYRAATIAFSLATGARASEVFAATRSDIIKNLKGSYEVRIRGTKTEGSARIVPVVIESCVDLLEFARKHADGKERLFAPWVSPHVDVNRVCDRDGIPHVSWNDYRRTFATRHVEAGVPLNVVATLLGHTSTTMVYRVYGKPSPDALAEQIRTALRR